MTASTCNQQLAAGLRHQAGDAMHRRKILLCASAALAESASVPAAVKILREWATGPPAIRDAAIELLGQLATETAP